MILKHLPPTKVTLECESKMELAPEVVCYFQTYLNQQCS